MGMGIRRGALALLATWTATAAPAHAQNVVPDACYGDGAAAVVCIINEGRQSLGLRKLRTNPVLTATAERYARQMAREDFFAHVDPDGDGPMDRLVDAGYGERRAGRYWRAGEVIGRGSEELSSPQAMAFMWLASPSHRRVRRRSGSATPRPSGWMPAARR